MTHRKKQNRTSTSFSIFRDRSNVFTMALRPGEINHDPLGITKTSGKLGQNHYCNGAWDRLKGQDSINQFINQAQMLQQYNCCVPGCTKSHNCSGAAFLLVLSFQTIPSALALLIPTLRFPLVLVMANWDLFAQMFPCGNVWLRVRHPRVRVRDLDLSVAQLPRLAAVRLFPVST